MVIADRAARLRSLRLKFESLYQQAPKPLRAYVQSRAEPHLLNLSPKQLREFNALAAQGAGLTGSDGVAAWLHRLIDFNRDECHEIGTAGTTEHVMLPDAILASVEYCRVLEYEAELTAQSAAQTEPASQSDSKPQMEPPARERLANLATDQQRTAEALIDQAAHPAQPLAPAAEQQSQEEQRNGGEQHQSGATFPNRANWVRKRRHEKGWSAHRMAQMCDSDQRTVERIERGERVKPSVFDRIARCFECSVSDIPAD